MTTALNTYDLPFGGTTMRCYEAGDGFPLVFVHGSGPGVDTLSNFQRVLAPLSERYRVLGIDIIGFGKSGRRPQMPYFDMGMWTDQVLAAVGHLGADQVGLVGHSLGGPIVLRAAAESAAVTGVIVTGTMGVPARGLSTGGPRWNFPTDPSLIRAHIARSMYDPALVPEDEADRRIGVLYAEGYEDYFRAMFPDADACIDAAALGPDVLAAVQCRVALMHGRYDATYPPEDTTLPIAKWLRHADVHILDRCAHSVAHERPDVFMAVVDELFG